MGKWKNREEHSPEVKFLLKKVTFEEILPKARDAVDLFFLNIKTKPSQGEGIHETTLLRPVLRSLAKKEDIIEKGGLKSIVSLLTSQTLYLQLTAARALGSLSTDADPSVLEALRTLNVHITVVKLAGNESTSDQLLLRILYILYNMGKGETCQMPIVRIRAVHTVATLLEGKSKVEPIVRVCYMVIAALSSNPATHEAIYREGGLDRAVKGVNHIDEQVRYQSLKILYALSRNDKGQSLLAQSRAVESLYKAISDRAHPLDDSTLGIALSTLGHLSANEEAQNQIADSGVIQRVAAMVHEALSNPTLLEKVLKAILNFSNYAGCADLLARAGIVRPLYNMVMSGDNITKTLATSILNNLAASDVFLGEIGIEGIVTLVNMMPPASVLMQRVIARIVKATARYDEVKNSLVQNACVSIFTGIMNQTKDDYVLAEIVDVLAILTKHERIRKVVIACGHTVRIVALLGSHLFERLQLPIITVVSNLSLEDVGIQAILKLQGAFALFSKFSLNHENVAVQAQSLMAISNLLVNDELRQNVIDYGVLEAAIYLMHSKDIELQEGALRLIAKIAKSSAFHQVLYDEDLVEHLKLLRQHENFKRATPLMVSAFRELVMSLKAGGKPTITSGQVFYWLKIKLGEYTRPIRVSTDILLDPLADLIRKTYGIKAEQKITLMFRDAGYPVVLHSSDELVLLWMNYEQGKRVELNVYEGDLPDEHVEEINVKPAPPAPPPPPPGLLAKKQYAAHPFAAPAYIKTHNPEDARKLRGPDKNNLLPENLMSDILKAVKNRAEGKQTLSPAGRGNNANNNGLSSSSQIKEAGEMSGEREFFRDVGKWYRGVQQVFLVYPIFIKVIFDIVDGRQDHKSFGKCFETAVANLPHMLPHMQGQPITQDEFAECLLKIGFNVKSSKTVGTDGQDVIRYDLIVRPLSLPPELLLKAILLATSNTDF